MSGFCSKCISCLFVIEGTVKDAKDFLREHDWNAVMVLANDIKKRIETMYEKGCIKKETYEEYDIVIRRLMRYLDEKNFLEAIGELGAMDGYMLNYAIDDVADACHQDRPLIGRPRLLRSVLSLVLKKK